MKIKRGSVTPVDLTGQADGDYIRNDAGVWKPKNSFDVLTDLLTDNIYENVAVQNLSYTATAETGAVSTREYRTLDITTGDTNNASVRASTRRTPTWVPTTAASRIDWRKKILIFASLSVADTGTTNGQTWLNVGDNYDAAVGDLYDTGIGFRIDNKALKGTCHNGTDLTVVDLGVSMTGWNARLLVASSDGTGQVEWFVNGVLEGQSANGPAALSDNFRAAIRLMVANNADNAIQRAYLSSLGVMVRI